MFPKNSFFRVGCLLIFCLSICNGLIGCTNPEQVQPTPMVEHQEEMEETYDITVNIDGLNLEDITVFSSEDQTYVPLVNVLNQLDYQVYEDEDMISAGFTDVLHEVNKDSRQALVLGEEVQLSTPVITYRGKTYMTTNDLQQFLGADFDVALNEETLNIQINELTFPEGEDLGNVKHDQDDLPVLSRSQADNIINTARQYMGTPYVFGARAGRTDVFDCSSFVQYVFYKNGITLPRNSRQQANLRHSNRAHYVSVNNLRRGDLVFFYWPGRFASNRTVGHVGIYAGNGRVIQTTPSNDVHHVNAADSSYWRRTYLGAIRVTS